MLIDEIILSIADNTIFFGGAADDIRERRRMSELQGTATEAERDIVRSGATTGDTELDEALLRELEKEDPLATETAFLVEELSYLSEQMRINNQNPGPATDALNNPLQNRRDEIISTLRELGVEGYSTGTKGFEDFGKGTLAMLHGREAVIPLDSPLGQMINNINSSAAIGSRPNIGRMPGLDFENRSTSVSSDVSKVEIDNISLLTENIQDMKNQLSSNINTANQGSIDSMKELNRLMSQVLTVLQAMAEDADGIERNTRSMGGNIANGRISAIR